MSYLNKIKKWSIWQFMLWFGIVVGIVVVLVAIGATFGVFFWWLPEKHKTVAVFFEMLTAAVILVGIVGLSVQVLLNAKRTKLAQTSNQNDRYNSGVGLFSELKTTLGGVQVLDNLVRENNDYAEQTIEFFCTYLRQIQLDYEDGGISSFNKNLRFITQKIMDTLFISDRSSTFQKYNNVLEEKRRDVSAGNLADLSGARLSGIDLTAAKLVGVNLEKADLAGAELHKANLEDANLTEANLEEANLEQANLVNANLTEADLTEADLTNTNLLGAGFSRPAQLSLFESDGIPDHHMGKLNIIAATSAYHATFSPDVEEELRRDEAYEHLFIKPR